MSNWIYVGIFLDEKSKKKLKKYYKVPDGWTEYFDHMTVVFNDNSKYVEYVKNICDKLGEIKVKLNVVGHGISDKAYAVRVNMPPGIPCTNKYSHITLATSPDGKAVDSNYIENWHTTTKSLQITGTLKVFEGN